MLKNYLKIAWRNLFRNKLYSLINVFGLSVGIACCVLIMALVMHEVSFDRFLTHKNSIYRVTRTVKSPNDNSTTAFVPMPMAPALTREFPEIQKAVRFVTSGAIVNYREKTFYERLTFTDPTILDMFDLQVVHGNTEKILSEPTDMVITTETAKKYFGDADPLGQTLSISTHNGNGQFIISGVVQPMPQNSSVQFDFLLLMVNHPMYSKAGERWSSSNGSAFVQLREGALPSDIEIKLHPFIEKYLGSVIRQGIKDGDISKDPDAYQIHFQPIRTIHLDTGIRTAPEKSTNPVLLWILSGIGLLVLLIACVNFMTLSIGRSANRAREIGVRKVLGAARIQLAKQFWGETMLLALIAAVLGMVLAELALPLFNTITSQNLVLNYQSNSVLLSGLVGLVIATGLVSGSYPALFLSRFEPVKILKGTFRVGSENIFTKSLIIFQFSISIVLIVATMVMSEQLKYLLSKDLGYQAEQAVVIPMYNPRNVQSEDIVERFRLRAMENAKIVNVTGTSGAFTQGYDINSFQVDGKLFSTFVYRVDEQYFETLQIPVLAGRNFSRAHSSDARNGIIVNEAFVKKIGWEEPVIGKTVRGLFEEEVPGGLEVIGVVSDFHFESLREEIKPSLFFISSWYPMDAVIVRIAADQKSRTMDALKKIWNDVAPNRPWDATFLRDDIQNQYQSEQRWNAVVEISTIIAIVLACLGLFGLAAISVNNRTKEIGIRKILGASVHSITSLISKQFVALVLAANLFGWPVAYLVTSKLLEQYAYRIELRVWMFIVPSVVTLLIAFATIATQAVRAGSSNPVDALRYE